MPKPKNEETKDQFIGRCIPVVIEDGTAKDKKQATAVCNSIWSEHIKESESEKLIDKFKKLCTEYEETKSQSMSKNLRSIETIIESTKVIIKEMLELNHVTFHPEQMKPQSKELLLECLKLVVSGGPYLSPPYGELIYENQKTAIVKTEKNDKLENMGLLISGDYAYGYIRCRECEQIDLNEFDKREKEHRLTESEIDNHDELYYYSIREFIKFENPRKIEDVEAVNMGDRFFESTHTPKDWNLSKLNNDELMNMHSDIHNQSISYCLESEKKPAKWIIKRHNFILTEMESRDLKHNTITELDRLSEICDPLEIIKLSDIDSVLSNDMTIRVPFLSIMGESCKTGHDKNINLNINWPEFDTNFIKLIESKIKEIMPEIIKDKINIIPDKDGNETTLIPIAELSIKFIKPENRIMMSCKQGSLNKLRLKEQEKLRGEK